jgi:hypothetical protein
MLRETRFPVSPKRRFTEGKAGDHCVSYRVSPVGLEVSVFVRSCVTTLALPGLYSVELEDDS